MPCASHSLPRTLPQRDAARPWAPTASAWKRRLLGVLLAGAALGPAAAQTELPDRLSWPDLPGLLLQSNRSPCLAQPLVQVAAGCPHAADASLQRPGRDVSVGWLASTQQTALTLRAWRQPSGQRAAQRGDNALARGAQLALELQHSVGDFSASAALSQPLRLGSGPTGGRAQHLGLAWRLPAGHALELGAEHRRQGAGDASEQRWTLRWAFAEAPGRRWALALTHQEGSAASPWRLSAGLRWQL